MRFFRQKFPKPCERRLSQGGKWDSWADRLGAQFFDNLVKVNDSLLWFFMFTATKICIFNATYTYEYIYNYIWYTCIADTCNIGESFSHLSWLLRLGVGNSINILRSTLSKILGGKGSGGKRSSCKKTSFFMKDESTSQVCDRFVWWNHVLLSSSSLRALRVWKKMFKTKCGGGGEEEDL